MTENRVIAHCKTCSLHRFPRNFVWMTEDCLYIYNVEFRDVWTSGSPAEATVCPEILAVHTVTGTGETAQHTHKGSSNLGK